jgi:hypothetical protein
VGLLHPQTLLSSFKSQSEAEKRHLLSEKVRWDLQNISAREEVLVIANFRVK